VACTDIAPLACTANNPAQISAGWKSRRSCGKRTQRSVITTGGLTSGRQTTHRPASCSAMLDQVHLRVDAGRGSVEREMTRGRAEEHTSELQSRFDLVCRLL